MSDDHRSAKFDAATRRLRRAGRGSRRSGDIAIFGIVGFADLCADSVVANDPGLITAGQWASQNRCPLFDPCSDSEI